MSDNDTLLPEINIGKLVEARATSRLDQATTRYTDAVADAHGALIGIAESAASRHSKPVDARNAAATLLEHFAQGVAIHGDRIVDSIGQMEQQTDGANQAQVQQLQGQVQALTASQDRLRDEARHASNLQARLDQAEAENARLQRELDQAHRDADQPNPLQTRVDELEAQLRTATADKEAAQAENTRLQGELDQAVADKEAAEQSANHWHQQAVDLGYVEPGSQPAPDPTPGPVVHEPDDHVVPGMQEPAPRQGRRRLRDRLPGHGRNQGAQDGGEE